jgi:dimethylglycine dehydrogenase
VHGEACYDTWVLDPRRFTGHANVELTALKAIEDYQNEFRFHFPHEHRPAGRPPRHAADPVLAAEGAEFTVVNGWERVDYIKPTPDFTEPTASASTRSSTSSAAEVRGARPAWASARSTASTGSRSPAPTARLPRPDDLRARPRNARAAWGLGYLLNHHGMIKGEATVANLPASDRGRSGSGTAPPRREFHDMDWLTAHLRPGEDVQIRSLTNDQTILVLAGPRRAPCFGGARGDWSQRPSPGSRCANASSVCTRDGDVGQLLRRTGL